jgi:hypothetical protein
MFGVVLTMLAVLVWRKPTTLSTAWTMLVLLILLLVGALWWALARPWTIVAATSDSLPESPSEESEQPPKSAEPLVVLAMPEAWAKQWNEQWALTGPWSVVAATPRAPEDTGSSSPEPPGGPLEGFGERWEGTVRGLIASGREVSRIARNLSHGSGPNGERGGRLQRVSVPVR